MKIGKIIAIIFGLICVFLIIYVMNSSKTNPAKINTTQNTKIKDLNSDIKKINEEIIIKTDEQYEKQIQNLEKEKLVLEKQEKFASVSTEYRVSCAPCHGLDGNGNIAPKIAKRSKEYILNMLSDFKTHEFENTLMNGLLKNISDDDLENLAEEISNFK